MESSQKFRWTEKANHDLVSIVDAANATQGIHWQDVASEFKQIYPGHQGKAASLRIQYYRVQEKCDKKGYTSPEENGQKFCWNNAVEQDLLSIVNATNKQQPIDWSNVAAAFKQLHSNYDGKDDTLRKQYDRIKNKVPVVEQFSWTVKAKLDLLSIVNSANGTNRTKWFDVETRFKNLYPNYEGGHDSLRMQYSRIEEHKDELVEPFKWTKNEALDLVRLVNLISVDGYPNWTKIWYTFKRYHPEYEGSKQDIQIYYGSLYNDKDDICLPTPKDELNEWDDTLDLLLAQAIGHAEYIRSAQIRDGRRKHIDNLAKMTVKIFKEFYKSKNGVEYIGTDAIVLKQFYEYKETLMPCSFICEEDVDSMTNIDSRRIQAYASKNHTLAYSGVLKECCHNCGMLFPRNRQGTTRKLLSNPIGDVPEVSRMRLNVPYTYSVDEKYYTCLECFKTPYWYLDYSVAISKSGEHSIPNELRNLNEYEQNQIALCGGFYSLYQKQNVQSKIFEHRQGECNIGKKRDIDYHNVFTTYFNIERPHKFDSSNDKIKAALRWLKKNNRLYKDFLSNYETIYGYLMSCYNLRPEERVIQISKGNLTDMVGKDTSGLFIPADNIQIESGIKPECHKFGVQHPLQDNLNKLRDIINVNYSDPDLEAKRWPQLFPEGNGSWRRNSSLKQQTYVKHRLLGLDDRFRRNNEFMFFWYDRLIKERLLYYNNRQRTVNVTELIDSIHVKDLRENVGKYGSVVPSSVSGSKTYWRARCLDLLALVRDLGKPSLFVTLTQNDNWLELQEVCGEISLKDMNLLNKPIMQPAIGGKSVVNYPVETVIAFYKRLDMFMQSCVHNKSGPFGEVTDYWFRIEYQNRGALHCHMVLWICEETLPDDVVTAELPRYSGENIDIQHQTFQAREYVKTFQIHTCTLGGCRKDIKARCKYGFPYEIQLSEEINKSKMGFTYMRHCEEDRNVVPHNIYALMCWNGHINVQKVTSNGIEAYLCKYVSKPERSIDIKDLVSDTDKFIKARVVGILECCAHLLQFHQVGSSRKTVFLPCDFQPKQRMLKRKSHLPSDNDSDDVYYQTLLYKYLVRPKELHNLTYVDLFRFYDVVYQNSKQVLTQNYDSQLLDDESESEFLPKCDETQLDFSGRIRKIKSQRITYSSNGYKYVERGKAAVPRWRFLMPFGNESEKYYEQRLLINVPITEDELDVDGYPFSDDNESKTFVEECCLRGLVDSEETAKSALLGAVQRGFSVDRVIEIATLFVDQSFVTKEFVDSIIIPWADSMPCVDDTQKEHDNEYGEELTKMLEMRVKYDPYTTYLDSMTESQRNVMEWVNSKIGKGEQMLAIISGGAGVGKSFITKALYSYFVEKKMVCILLATTGSAAHLISGTTVHYYLKVDIYGNKYLQHGTIAAKIVEETDVIIIDEFSMLNSDLLDQINDCTKEFGKSKRSPFGGKHLFLIGDPCQLPAINQSVFCNPLLNAFSILLLKETVRQKDEVFAALLNRLRVNMLTEEDNVLLRTRYTHVSNIECDEETLIVTATRNKMKFYNNQFITQLPGEKVVIVAQDFESDTNKEVSFSVKEKIRRYLTTLWDEQLIVKEGCIVRLLRNLDVTSGWVNSKRAKVLRAANDGSFIVLQDINDPSKQLPLTKMRQPFKLGVNLYYRLQYPLILGYATTVHAVQGTTVTGKYYVDLDRSFWESGQAFVALSRPKELSQLFLLNTHFEKVSLKTYYKDLLDWMIDVDEISIMRKPRRIGDFPLLTVEEQDLSKIQIYPLIDAVETKTAGIKNPPFKPPRTLNEESATDSGIDDSLNEPLFQSPNNVVALSAETSQRLPQRIYRLADSFINTCRNSSIAPNKIRFGVKFMDELLRHLNETLGIHDVEDPLFGSDNVSRDKMRKWDDQKSSTLNLFRKCASQFRAEFEMYAGLIFDLDICEYAGQEVASHIPDLYRENCRYRPVRTIGDGRCFYHSVSFNLIGNSTLSNSLKLFLSFEICNAFEIYDDIFSGLGSSAGNVLLKVLSSNCWADMEIITALAYALKRPITVISRFDGIPGIPDQEYNPFESDSERILIAHVKLTEKSEKLNHFIALLLDDINVESGNSFANLNEHVNEMSKFSIINTKENSTLSLPVDDVEMLDVYDSLTESL